METVSKLHEANVDPYTLAKDMKITKELIQRAGSGYFGDPSDRNIRLGLLDSCRTGMYKRSNNLVNALVQAVKKSSKFEADDDPDTSYKDAVEDLCGSDEWDEGMIVDTFYSGLQPKDLVRAGVSQEFAKAWAEGLDDIDHMGWRTIMPLALR